ncbi:TraX family protein [Paenibacillus sp. UNC451MF]|uniref:TraX family protein n=1 Tax=Paenibacillus sp. UNC451MF TaxID=1449063 RepID=UPI00049106A6|nr:TraX family protein [Paenibacillus sp. UNC451MF]
MQLIAMLTMLIDHIGLVFFQDQAIWRMVGRIAFPIYAYFIVVGYTRTRNLKLYMVRLFIIALLSQVPFMLALGARGVNAVGTLLMCVIILYLIENTAKSVWLPAVIAMSVAMEALSFDYGLYGVLLVLIYKYTKSHYMVLCHFALNVLFLFLKGWVIEAYSIITTVAIVYAPTVWKQVESIRMPRWLWRSFYPVHLTAIAILEFMLSLKP